jgi:CTP:molybdopterin cytidylyltransferase MocA
MTEQKITALVMAASRAGPRDSVAQLQDKTHKCLVDIAGQVMLVRVISTLIKSGCFDRLAISIEDESVVRAVPQVNAWMDDGLVVVTPSRGNLADSILAAAEALGDPLPMVVTTGDNALHTPELVRDFVSGFLAATEDVSLGFTSEEVVQKQFPGSGLAYHRIKDGGWSACNLYGLRTEASLTTARIFEGGGQFGKRHLRILKAFGVMPFLLYKLKWATLDEIIGRIANNMGITASVVNLPYAFGPIDVDNPKSFGLSERELLRRS